MYSGGESECLFAGDLAPELRAASPFLVRLEFDDKTSIRLIEESWGKSWAVFLNADLGLRTLRKHLRTLFRVRDPQGRYCLFRYYDPRVLRVYLPECTPGEVEAFTGPVRKWWAEGPLTEDGGDPQEMLCFDASHPSSRLKTSVVGVAAPVRSE